MSGLAAGIIYHLLRRFVARPWMRTTAFIVICGLISWRGVHGVAPIQQAMFMALPLSYLIVIDVMGRLATGPVERQHTSFNLTG